MQVFEMRTPLIEQSTDGFNIVRQFKTIGFFAAKNKKDLKILAEKVGVGDIDIYFEKSKTSYFSLCQN